MLVDKNEYLSAGLHIGMKTCTAFMKQFVYKTREDGLSVFNLQEVDERIAKAINLLSKYNKIMVASHKEVAQIPVKKFSELTDSKAMITRFSPGTLTNPSYREFYEPDAIIVVDPLIDKQAIEEAKKKKIVIIGLCDTYNDPVDIDFIIPINNNSTKSLALFFSILSKGLMKAKGKIKADEEFTYTLKDFGDTVKPKKARVGGELDLGDVDVDIDIEIENKDAVKKKGKRENPKAASSRKGPKKPERRDRKKSKREMR